MDYKTYQERVLARASTEWHGENIDRDDFRETLKDFIEAGNRLDRLKKSLFYGRPFQWTEGVDNIPVETPLMGATDDNLREQQLVHAILGFATEGVEMIEMMLKSFDEGELDDVNLQEEFGDGEWYRALALHALGQTHEANLAQNDSKLEKRFGPAFTAERANNRDLDAERKVLEGK